MIKLRFSILRGIFFTLLFFTLVYGKMFPSMASADITTSTGLAVSAWPCKGHDAGRTGQSPYIGAQTNTVKWQYQTGKNIHSSPALDSNGVVYVGSDDQNIHAFYPDGGLKWSFLTEGPVKSSPAIGDDGTIYVGSNDQNIYALNSDGSLKWKLQTEAEVKSSPIIGSDGTIYFTVFYLVYGSVPYTYQRYGKVYALNSDGSVKWSYCYQTESEIEVPLAIGIDGTIYLGGNNIYALRPEDGSLKWKYTLQEKLAISSLATAADGTIYAAGHIHAGDLYGILYAVNPNGSLKWSYQTEERFYSTPAIGEDGTIYISSSTTGEYSDYIISSYVSFDGKVRAFHPNGSLAWMCSTGSSLYSSSVHPSSKPLPQSDHLYSSPALGADGTIYIGGLNDKFYAINQDGTLKWSSQTGGKVESSPAIGADGTVYVGSNDGALYAFGTVNEPAPNPLELICPSDIMVTSTATLTEVTYTAMVTDSVDPNPIVIYDPAPGSQFPIGSTEVTVTAVDSYNNNAACSFMVIVGPGGLAADSAWPCRGHDEQHTGQSPYIGAQTNTLKWSLQTGSYVDSIFYALHPEDGSVKWTFETGGLIFSTAALGTDGTIYMGSSDKTLYALKPDGTLKWSYLTEGGIGGITSSPVIAGNGTIYVAGNALYALNPEDGSLLWSSEIGGDTWSSPAIGSKGTVFIGGNNGKFYALNPEDGSLKWSRQTGYGIFSSPAIGTDGTVYFGSFDHQFYALNPEDGSIKWTYQSSDMIYSSPAISTDGTIYGGSFDGKIFALAPEDGSLKWSYQTADSVYSSPVIGADGTIYIGSMDKRVYALHGQDGALKWVYETEKAVDATPSIGADGTVYVGGGDGKIYAFTTGSIIVEDTEPPSIICPDDMVVLSAGTPIKVTFSTTVTDNIDPKPEITYNHEPGSQFPIGTTQVTLTAVDDNNNSSTCIFMVTVEDIGQQTKGLADSAWPCKGHDAKHTGQSPYVGVQSNVLKWSFQTGGYLHYSTPTIGIDGTIYVGSCDDNFYAVNPEGSLKWSFETGYDIMSSPAIGTDGTIYFGSKDKIFYALYPDGTQKWRYQTDCYITSSAALGIDGTIYFGCYNHKVYALTSEGNLKWTYQTGDYVRCSPAVGDDGTVYIGSHDGYFYAIGPNGQLKWKYKVGAWCDASPAIGDDCTVYVGSSDNRLYAFNPDGNLKWRYKTNGWIDGAPSISNDGTIYFSSNDHNLYSLYPDGTLKEKISLGYNSGITPALGADGLIYIAGVDGKLSVFTPEGALKCQMDFFFNSSPCIAADGTVYIGNGDGKLYAFGPAEDIYPPEIICPEDIHLLAAGELTQVNYTSTVSDNLDLAPSVLCEPESGSWFPVGITQVSITATDFSGNMSACTFTVTIEDTTIEPGGLSDSAWPCRGHDGQHTGQSPYLGAQENKVKWSFLTEAAVTSSPTIGSDCTVYIGGHDGKIYAFSSSGNLEWSYQTGDEIHSSAAIGAGGTIYIGSNDGNVYALKADGSLKWMYQTGWGVDSSPTIGADGTIYVGSNDGKVYALEQNGVLKWSFQTDSYISSSPAIGADGTIYIGGGWGDGQIYALNPDDGTLIWSCQIGDSVYSSPAIGADGTIYAGGFEEYFGEYEGRIIAINPENGSQKWAYQVESAIIKSSPALGEDGTLYFGSGWGEGKVYALNSEDGSLKWSFQTGDDVESSPSIGADGAIYIGSNDGYIYAFNSEDGSLKWSFQTDEKVESSPAIGADGTIYIGSNNGYVYAFGAGQDNPSNGKKVIYFPKFSFDVSFPFFPLYSLGIAPAPDWSALYSSGYCLDWGNLTGPLKINYTSLLGEIGYQWWFYSSENNFYMDGFFGEIGYQWWLYSSENNFYMDDFFFWEAMTLRD